MKIRIAYWNINSIRSKVERDEVLKTLTDFDMFWLSELKTKTDIHVPGYKCFRSEERYDTHGGIALFIKYSLVAIIKEVKHVQDDAVSVTFISAPNVLFSGWYIPPSDSKYADNRTFARMSSLLRGEDRSVVLVGDFNAKMKDRDCTIGNRSYTYNNTSPDRNHNHYGERIQCITEHNELVLLNGLKTAGMNYLDDSLTYRKRNVWVSQLDLMFCSQDLLQSVTEFKII